MGGNINKARKEAGGGTELLRLGPGALPTVSRVSCSFTPIIGTIVFNSSIQRTNKPS